MEENHYYPFGLPIKTLGSSTPELKEQRRRYQGNEYITDAGLNWMDFANRQYDPQIGRFLGVDPLAAYGDQDRYSPYAAMGNMPELMVDPQGLSWELNNPIGGSSYDASDRRNGAWMLDLNRDAGAVDVVAIQVPCRG